MHDGSGCVRRHVCVGYAVLVMAKLMIQTFHVVQV